MLRDLHHKNNISLLTCLLAGSAIAAAFFTNGLQAFFPWLTPLLYQCVYKKQGFLRAIAQSAALFFFTIIIIALVLLHHPAHVFLRHYLNNQLLPTLTGMRSSGVTYRGFEHLYGLLFLLAYLSPLCVVIAISVFFYTGCNKTIFVKTMWSAFLRKNVLFLFLMGLGGALPVLISDRQADHYFLQAFPFFVLAIVVALTPSVLKMMVSLAAHAVCFRRTVTALTLLFLVSLASFIYTYGKPSRKLQDVLAIAAATSHAPFISTEEKVILHDWSFRAFLYRYAHMNIVSDENCPVENAQDCREWLLIRKNNNHTVPRDFSRVNISLHSFVLYRAMPR